MVLYPLIFTPVLKHYIWGGRNLERYGRELPNGKTAESWEIAAHKDGTTHVANGIYSGWPLTKLQDELGLDLIGHNNGWAHERGKFPLLIKLLDANRPLSVQVHPDDEFALAHEGNELGKSEMWVVLDAKPGAELIVGVKEGTTPELFQQAIQAGELEPYLHYLPVKSGDHVCVPAGSLHAIMGGLIIGEIQQNSNTTYRVYDWNRLGQDGEPRPLHVEKALQVINFDQIEPEVTPPELLEDTADIERWRLCQNQYFITERLTLSAGSTFAGRCTGETMEILGITQGTASINSVNMSAIQFCLLPAALGEYRITAISDATLLRSYTGSN